MHCAYFSSCASVGPDWPDGLKPAAVLAWVVVDWCLPTPATPLCTRPAPHAVTQRLRATSTTSTFTGRLAALVTCPVSHLRQQVVGGKEVQPDLVPGNVLVAGGRLVGVLDVGGLAPADPALGLVWYYAPSNTTMSRGAPGLQSLT